VVSVCKHEFSSKGKRVNVENAVRNLKVSYPALSYHSGICAHSTSEYWPRNISSMQGTNRYTYFGKDDYGEIERVIRSCSRNDHWSRQRSCE